MILEKLFIVVLILVFILLIARVRKGNIYIREFKSFLKIIQSKSYCDNLKGVGIYIKYFLIILLDEIKDLVSDKKPCFAHCGYTVGFYFLNLKCYNRNKFIKILY